ncbi:MAG: glycosyltransferase family 4 protein [Desulfurivibrionaceae bacterium]
MKIGLVTYDSPDLLTGGYLYNRYLVDFLGKANHRTEVISLPGGSYLSNLCHNFSSGIYRKLAAGYDVLIQDALAHPSLFYLNNRLHRESDTTILALVHCLRSVMCRRSPFRSIYNRNERRYFERVDGVICTSSFTGSMIENHLKPGLPSVVARPGGDRFADLPGHLEIQKRAGRSHEFRILFLGNLLPGKRLHDLCTAVASLPDTEIRLSIAGSMTMDPGYCAAVQKQIDRSGLRPRVDLHGSLQVERLQEELQQAHLLAVPSDSEAFGIAYLEGFAFGLPAIGGTRGGASEIITHGENGYLVKPGDVASLSRYLHKLHRDREMLSRMSLAARRTYESYPSWSDSMGKIHSFINEISLKEGTGPCGRR